MKKLNLKLTTLLVVLVAVVLVGCLKNEDIKTDALNSSEINQQNAQAELITYSSDVIPGQYIVVYKKDAVAEGRNLDTKTYKEKQVIMKEEASATLNNNRISTDKVEHVYGTALKGFSVALNDEELATLRQDPQIDYIEQDQVISVKMGGPPGGNNGGAQETPWGIDRVGGSGNGTGKRAWIIDSGIDLDHPDLNVDVANAANFASGNSANDGHGHGSHVAGTIGAIDNEIGVIGVAANASVVPVRVLGNNGSGSTSGVIAGVDYVGANAVSGEVANMSLGGGVSTTLDNAVVDAAGSSGCDCAFILAAGNESDEADNHSPARAEGSNIVTISAMDINDNWASFSNYDFHVDYCGPGVGVKSTFKGGGYKTYNGTSMAAPHVAGIVLLASGNINNINTNGNVNGDPDGNPGDPIAHR